MEFEDIIKYIWGALILVIFVVSRFKVNKREEQSENYEMEPLQPPLDFEQIFEQQEESHPEPKIKRVIKVVEPKSPAPQSEDLIEQPKPTKRGDFDLRKAVIMSEILTPKFKNE